MSFLFIAMLLAMAGVLIVLMTGIVGMVHGGEFNRKYGNRLMRARIILQGVAIALFLLYIMSQHNT